ncbi:hypothetical protein MWU59_05035 [Flavobacteriaceae bacterium F08102]|nr:hypothetical protein [Flavobacteriaceae bacterium F08102]
MKKLPLIVAGLCLVFNLQAQSDHDTKPQNQDTKTTSWYTSNDTEGYIKIEESTVDNKTVLTTEVVAKFDDEQLNFTLVSTNDDKKLLFPSRFKFTGTIDSEIKPVTFTGTRIKTVKNGVSFWNFQGDFVDQLEKDPDIQKFAFAKYNATLKIPERTVPSFNLWSIIPNLEFSRKGTFIFNSLDETKLYVNMNQTVNYLGLEEISVQGVTTKTHKFVHQGKGIKKSYFWVSDDHQLLQIKLDDKFTFSKSTEKQALQSIEIKTASVTPTIE